MHRERSAHCLLGNGESGEPQRATPIIVQCFSHLEGVEVGVELGLEGELLLGKGGLRWLHGMASPTRSSSREVRQPASFRLQIGAIGCHHGCRLRTAFSLSNSAARRARWALSFSMTTACYTVWAVRVTRAFKSHFSQDAAGFLSSCRANS